MRRKTLGLTNIEKEVLHLLTDEFLTIKQIQIRRDCSFQAVYKIIKKIKEKLPYFQVHREKEDRILKVKLETNKENPNEKFFIVEGLEKCYCYFCDFYSEEIIQAHHIVPKSKGGNNERNNILYICPNCHRLIHKRGYNLRYSKGYYYIINEEKDRIVYPSIRQLDEKRINQDKEVIMSIEIPEKFNSFGEIIKNNKNIEVCNEKNVQST